MDSAEDKRRAAARPAPRAVDAFLAGLQAGTLGTLWMLAWMGFSAAWQRRSFWTAENLMASAFHPNGPIPPGFEWSSLSGLALYLLLYGSLGGLFAMLAARHHLPPVRAKLLAVVVALAWYYFSFQLFWKTFSPVIAYLHPGQSTVAGHLIYGLFLGRFYTHLVPAQKPYAGAEPGQETASDSVAPGA